MQAAAERFAKLTIVAWTWRGGDSPPFVAMWTLHVALVIVLGVLWFDWLFGAEVDFERFVAVPLMLSALATAALAAWQLFGDMRFVNPTVFAARGRTTGAIYDANVLGILSALWIGGAFLCAERLRGWPRYAAAVTMIASAIAVWGSGSKSALVAAVLITLVIPVSMRGTWLRSRRAALGAALAMGTVAVSVVVGFGYASARAGNPAARMWRDVNRRPRPASARQRTELAPPPDRRARIRRRARLDRLVRRVCRVRHPAAP